MDDLVDRGCTLLIERPIEAEKLIKTGLLADPLNASIWYNLGIAKHQNKKIKAAIKCYKKAIERNESAEVNRLANNNLAQELLLNGDWKEGWKRYIERYRHEKEEFRIYENLFGPSWAGFSDTRNFDKLIIVGEQGYGDAIQFIRFISELQTFGIKTCFYGPEYLRKLFTEQARIGKIISMLKSDNSKTLWCPLMRLPEILSVDKSCIPLRKGYITHNIQKAEEWNKKLIRDNSKKLIGIHWQGNRDFEKSIYSRGRSMPVDIFTHMESLKNVEFVILQKGESHDYLFDNTNLSIVKGQSTFTNSMSFTDTAAVLSNCDLVISSDSCIVHLAGAMGVNVALMLSFIPEWRWGTNGSECIWYESVKIYRQKFQGDWSTIMKEIRSDIADFIFWGEE